MSQKTKLPEIITLPASYYQQFDADFGLDVPAEGYGGWKKAEIEISRDHTALVVMHAWDMGTREKYPGWHRAVEYIPRANKICQTVFPKLLSAVREAGFKLFHVVGGSSYYYSQYPGYQRAVKLAGAEPERLESIKADPILEKLRKFRDDRVSVGRHNAADVAEGFKNLDFHPAAKPVGDEGIAENGNQLFALCKEAGVNHLIYTGFAINWCLLLSPGGMADMSKRGIMCSVIRQATTAVENKESAREELHKEEALWRVALAFGFVFDVDDFIKALRVA
ncbi:MAG: hypothetical protein QHH26_05375 [Armatimonadota bacterium]|nr:hypothetical protein [Armatimonadota bacterium]